MPHNSIFKKSSSIIAAAIISTTAIIPVGTAHSHERHNANRHYGHGQHLTKQQHRKFHNRYGRGQNGTHNYRTQQRQHHQQHSHKKRRNKKGELIAAGIIGIAVGAIIASEASKRKQRSHQPDYYDRPQQPRQPHYDTSRFNGSDHRDHIPLNNYDRNGPNVITFNEPSTLEPWTPGWREWCENRYRSFNPSTGTFRGYDGLDHFCVPK